MIKVFGNASTEENAFAMALVKALAALWPGVQSSPNTEDDIRVAANVKLSGYKVSDIDVVAAGVFDRPRYFVPKKGLKDAEGNDVHKKVRVSNFIVAIEVKGHGSEGIRISGNDVSVRYGDGWKSATDQNVKQVHAIVKYLADQRIEAFVLRCLALQGLQELPLHQGQKVPGAGAVALGFSGTAFLEAIAGVYTVRKGGNEYFLSSGTQASVRRALGSSIFSEIVPSRLDRQRMDRIASQRDEAVRIAPLLGKQRVHLRGHGGTGKTVLMLQAAHEAYARHGKRCLVLTYNVALSGDIQRVLALLGVPGESEGGGVEVRTVMSFMYAWLARLGATSDNEESGLASYQAHCVAALEMFMGGALGAGDVNKVIASDPGMFGFDAIIVDEAQDWPQAEADLLSCIYGAERIAIVDGVGQLVRGRATDWKKTLPASSTAEDRHLTKCLRMKRNLGVFANAVASAGGLNWEVELNDEAAGGRVILLFGRYASHPALLEELVRAAVLARNEKIDFLHCVPPSNVQLEEYGPRSKLAGALQAAGHSVWDAVDPSARRDFPRSTDVFRVVQYDSCRGLEGWTTVLECFDEFWAYKYNQAIGRIEVDGTQQLRSAEDTATSEAWRWAMIALTRPIDTLVISFTDGLSPMAVTMRRIAEQHPDFVEIK